MNILHSLTRSHRCHGDDGRSSNLPEEYSKSTMNFLAEFATINPCVIAKLRESNGFPNWLWTEIAASSEHKASTMQFHVTDLVQQSGKVTILTKFSPLGAPEVVKITTRASSGENVVKISFRFPWQWRHSGRDSVSNHQPRECLLNRLFRRRSKKKSKLRVTGLCAGNSPETGEFPAPRASNAENGCIWWRHHAVYSEATPPSISLHRLAADVPLPNSTRYSADWLQICMLTTFIWLSMTSKNRHEISRDLADPFGRSEWLIISSRISSEILEP